MVAWDPGVSLSSEHLFDKAQADALLPRLVHLIRGLQEAAGSEAAASGFEAAAEMQAVLDEIDEMGVVLRDLATGLCDFPSVRDGRPVYLCWQLDEDEVGWGHK